MKKFILLFLSINLFLFFGFVQYLNGQSSQMNWEEVYSTSCNSKDVKVKRKVFNTEFRTNPDGTKYYKTRYGVEINNSFYEIPQVHYCGGDKTENICGLMNGGTLYLYILGYTGSMYNMSGAVYNYSDGNNFITEQVFTSGNKGFYSYLTINNGTVELSHFAYAGYFSRKATRSSNGVWTDATLGQMQPDEAVRIWKTKSKIHCVEGSSNNALILPNSTLSAAPSNETHENQIAIETVENGVKIGKQTWTAKNLNVDKFRNGDPIPEAKTKEDWIRASGNNQPIWCYYGFNSDNGATYGKLYNWYALIDSRGLAPEGWTIPNQAAWVELIDFLRGDVEAGRKIKSRSGWEDNGNGTNESGFSSIPGGFVGKDGLSYNIGTVSLWWTLTELNSSQSTIYLQSFEKSDIKSATAPKINGVSVRCIKDVAKTSDCIWMPSLEKAGYRYSWSGGCKDGKLDGEGTLIWFENDKHIGRYHGQMKNGRANGFGRTEFASGDKYEGNHLDGKKHGYGEYYHGSAYFKGEFKDGEFWNGTGKSAGGQGFLDYSMHDYKWVNGTKILNDEETPKYSWDTDDNSSGSSNSSEVKREKNYENISHPGIKEYGKWEDAPLSEDTRQYIMFEDGTSGYLFNDDDGYGYHISEGLDTNHYYKTYEATLRALYVYRKYSKIIKRDQK